MSGTTPDEAERAYAHLQAYYHLEEWYTLGQPDGLLQVDTLPFEHRLFARRDNRVAFEHYRAALLAYYEQAVLQTPMSSLLRSLLSRLESLDAGALGRFIEVGEDAIERFVEQRNNAYRKVRPLLDADPPIDRVKLEVELRTILSGWVDYYECDLPLWFLGVLGKALRSGKMEPDSFGGPNSPVPQGSLINSVAEAIADTPLASTFGQAYESALRNVVQHNDFRIDADANGELRVVGLTTGAEWTQGQIYARIVAQQALGEAVACAIRWARHVLLVDEPVQLAQEGIVSAAFAIDDSGVLVVALLQLWCFRELDPAGTWLDSGAITVTPGEGGEEAVHFGDYGVSIGPPVSTGPMGEAIRERGWARVLRLSVAPALGLGHPTYDVTENRRYELVGPVDAHWLPVSLKGGL